jgi:pyruvate formate lyase activating enzyme
MSERGRMDAPGVDRLRANEPCRTDVTVGGGSQTDDLDGSPVTDDRDARQATTCRICPHACRLRKGQLGRCRARRAVDGHIVCENYGQLTSLALDPIEKKPIARYHPGTTVLSLGSYGCNLHCPFCQNASIAMAGPGQVPTQYWSPKRVVQQALALVDRGCIGIAYTYNEPCVSFEYVRDTAQAAHEAGLVNVLVSNGMIAPEPLEEIAGLIDAANIDLKGATQRFYDWVGGDLETVKRTIERLVRAGCHTEVTTLVIPGHNDDRSDIAAMARWLGSVDRRIVYHLTRFFPQYKMTDATPTPISTLRAAKRVAERYLDTVLLGNV